MLAELARLGRPVRALGQERHQRLGHFGGADGTTCPAHPVCRAAGGCHGIPEGGASATRGRQGVSRRQAGLGEHVEVTADGVGMTSEARGEGRRVDRAGAAGELGEDPQPDAVERREVREGSRAEGGPMVCHMA